MARNERCSPDRVAVVTEMLGALRDAAGRPVHCDTTHDHAVYVEPNVWIRHGVNPHAV